MTGAKPTDVTKPSETQSSTSKVETTSKIPLLKKKIVLEMVEIHSMGFNQSRHL